MVKSGEAGAVPSVLHLGSTDPEILKVVCELEPLTPVAY